MVKNRIIYILVFLIFSIIIFSFIFNNISINYLSYKYNIINIQEKTVYDNGSYHYYFNFIKDNKLIEGRTTQIENIPCDSINAQKCQLVKYRKERILLFFDPIKIRLIEFRDTVKSSSDEIIYKNGKN